MRETSDRAMMLKLTTKAMKLPSGSQAQKDVIKKLNVLRIKLGMKPLKEIKNFKQMYEKLGKNADMGDYIDDFKKSDAPQFKGKSQEKRKNMAIAAFLSKNEKEETKLDEIHLIDLVKSVTHRMTHPRGYESMIKDYIKNVSKDKNNRQTNADHLHQVAKERGYDRIRPLVDYINTLVKKGKLPKELAAEYEKEINTPIDEGK